MIQNDKSFCINLIDLGTFQFLFWIIFTLYGMMMSFFSFLVMWIDSYESIQLIPQNPNISICVQQSKTSMWRGCSPLVSIKRVGGRKLKINWFRLLATQIEMSPKEVTSYFSILDMWIDFTWVSIHLTHACISSIIIHHVSLDQC